MKQDAGYPPRGTWCVVAKGPATILIIRNGDDARYLHQHDSGTRYACGLLALHGRGAFGVQDHPADTEALTTIPKCPQCLTARPELAAAILRGERGPGHLYSLVRGSRADERRGPAE